MPTIAWVLAQETGKLKEAIEAYDKAVSINPNSASTYNNIGLAFYNLNKFDEAEGALRKALAVDPTMP